MTIFLAATMRPFLLFILWGCIAYPNAWVTNRYSQGLRRRAIDPSGRASH